MRYLGGKGKIAKWVASAILSRKADATTYLEPFVGSGAVFRFAAPPFDRSIAADSHPDLIAMWKAIAEGWMPPRNVSREEHAALKGAATSAMRGFVGFGASFGGLFFHSYARDARGIENYVAEARSSTMTVAPSLRRSEIVLADYRAHEPGRGWVVYCDPPYAATYGYEGSGGAFDSAAFWETAARWASRGATVLVSEYSAPAGWRALGIRSRGQALRGGTAPGSRGTVTETIWVPTDRR